MYRKTKDMDYVEPMPKKQLHRIMKAFKRCGGVIYMSEDINAHLLSQNAEGSTLNALTILLKTNPGRAAVFEELIHSCQYRNGKMDGSYMSRLCCEIEAQRKLIQYAEIYRLTDIEIKQTQRALMDYESELNAFLKGGN